MEEWISKLWYVYTMEYTQHDMGKSQNNDTEKQRPKKKEHIPYQSIYIKFQVQTYL